MKIVFHEESYILAEKTQFAGIANSLTGDTLCAIVKNIIQNTMKNLLIFVTIFFFNFTKAQDKINREAFKLDLAVDSKQYYSTDVPKSPYFVKEKILQIYCSEKLLVETEFKADTIYSMKVVEKNKYPEKTIEISFTQDDKDREKIITILNVKNPFNKTLKYNAMMFTPYSQKWKGTSIIPIEPKLQNYESWPHTIITLVLDNWRLE